jgi:hypothetical protein
MRLTAVPDVRIKGGADTTHRFHEMMVLLTCLSANSIAVDAYSNRLLLIDDS